MTKDELKNKLLDTNMFVDNEYLEKYAILIFNNIQNMKNINYEKHHIIPKNCFKELKITDKKIINAKSNFVYLSFKNHCMAHYFLYKCANNLKVERNNLVALFNMLHEKHINDIENILESDFKEYDSLRLLWRQSIGKYNKGQKRPKISEYLLKHHFDCSGENNSRAQVVRVFDLYTHKLLYTYGAQCIAAKELNISNLKERLNKSKFGLIIYKDYIITKEETLNEENLSKELQRQENLRGRKRKLRVFKCSCCNNNYSLLLCEEDYQERLRKNNFCCYSCSTNGSYFRGKVKSSEQKIKIGKSHFGLKWIYKGNVRKQVSQDKLEEYVKSGWTIGVPKRGK